MTTVPTVTRFDDFRIALWNLATGTKTVLNPEALLDLQFETVPGVGGDRLKSATFQMPWYAEGRAAFDYDALQLVQIDRYSDAAWTLWGIVLKPKEGYSGRVARDAIQVQVVQIEELLKARKVHYSEEDGGGPITAVNAYPDDFAKLLVTKVFSGTDVDGNSRAWGWGTLAVAADASECAETASFALLSGDEEDDNLYKHVDGMARAYDFDYQLKVSVTGGAFTFTFETQAPYGGDDLTAGANRVMVKDLYNLVPSATRYRDAAMRATAMYVRGYSDILLDAAAITAWGRWEGVAAGTLLSDAEVALEKARVKEGAEYGFEATGANGMVRWLEDFRAGDKCLRINNRLGIAGDSEKIAAVIGRFQNKVLQLTIRWGDREPGLTDRQSGGGYAPGGGDGTVPIVAKPVQTDGSTGVDPHAHVYGDHEHALRLTADDTNYAAIDANGVLNVVGAGGVATSVVDGDLVITGPGDCLWVRDGATDYLRPATYGDGINIYDKAQGLAFTITPDGDIIGNIQAAGGAANRFLDLRDYDIATSAGGASAGIHDIVMSGGLTSETTTTASGLRWLGGSDGEDFVWIRNWSVWGDAGATVLRARYTTADGLQLLDADGSTPVFTVAPTTGHSVWKAGATWTIEGDTYTLPTAYPATSGMALVSTDAGVLSWAAPSIGNGTAQWQVLVTGASPFTPSWTALSYNPGAAQKPLMSNASGHLTLERLYLTNANVHITNATDSLGLSGTNGIVFVGATGTVYLDVTGQPALFTTSAFDLGISAQKWGDLWLSGDANIGDLAYTWPVAHASGALLNNGSGTLSWGAPSVTVDRLTSGSLYVIFNGSNLYPSGLGHSISIGSSDNRFVNLWLSGSITLGSNIIVGGTVDGVDLGAFKTAYDAHTHPYDKADSYTGDWSTSGYSDGDRGWHPVYDTAKTTLIGYHKLTGHKHPNSYTSTATGAP